MRSDGHKSASYRCRTGQKAPSEFFSPLHLQELVVALFLHLLLPEDKEEEEEEESGKEMKVDPVLSSAEA